MSISDKIWGTTESVEINPTLEFHKIVVDKGGVCSEHKHSTKWNGFFVESGELIIRVWQNDILAETVVAAGNFIKIPPDVYHQFECTEHCTAYELYWAELRHADIERRNTGFKRA